MCDRSTLESGDDKIFKLFNFLNADRFEKDDVDKAISVLSTLYPTMTEPILQLVEDKKVKKMVAHPSGRTIFEVDSSVDSAQKYLVLSDMITPFCTCPAYNNTVKQHRSPPICKHWLAAQISNKMGAEYIEQLYITDQYLNDIYLDILAFPT